MKFDVTNLEADLIVQSLGKQPFEVVYQLINKLQSQAQVQLAPKPPKDKSTK